jgi:hypothetical protein
MFTADDAHKFFIEANFNTVDHYTRQHTPVCNTSAVLGRKYFSLKSARENEVKVKQSRYRPRVAQRVPGS